MPLLRKPVGGRSVKNLDGAPRMDPNPIPPQASALDYAVTSSSDPETTSDLGATSKVGGITPCWL